MAKPAVTSPGVGAGGPSSEEELRKGRYGVIRSLLRALEGGVAAKAILDSIIDAASSMQNLREALTGYRARLLAEANEGKRNALLEVCGADHTSNMEACDL